LQYHNNDVLINALEPKAQSAETPCSTAIICLKIFIASSTSCCYEYE